MTLKRFLVIFVRNSVIAVVLSVVILGGLGFLLAGRTGLENGAFWGLLLGLLSMPFVGFSLLMPRVGQSFGGLFRGWVDREVKLEDKDHHDI